MTAEPGPTSPAAAEHPERILLSDALTEALAGLAARPSILVALDFDGTLAPLQDDPAASRALPEAASAIRALASLPGVHVALVSGRGLENLREVGEADPRVLLVGSHGAEWDLGHGRQQAESDAAALAELADEVRAALADVPDARLDVKPHGVTVHSRGLGAEQAQRIAVALAPLRARPHVTARDGHDIVELALSAATKADGLTLLRAHTGAEAVLFAGDDVTDEDALAALGPEDVGIRVGEGASRARFRVADAAVMARVLTVLLEERFEQRHG